MEENLGSVILENNRIAVIRPDGTLEILVVSAGRTEPISISSFSPSDTQLLLDLLAGKKAAQQSVHPTVGTLPQSEPLPNLKQGTGVEYLSKQPHSG